MKKIIGKLHLILGLVSGLVVFIVGLTGAIYAWEEDARHSMYSGLLKVESGSNRCSLDSCITLAQAAHPKQTVKFVRVVSDQDHSVEVGFKDKESVFVNQYTRKVLGSYNRDNDFFGIILQLHRRLMLGDTGKTITGISCLIFGFMLLSGIYLWWPRSRNIRRQRFRIALKAPRARKIFDLHSVLGFYAAWILIFSVITGLVWSFKWFEKGMYAVAGSEKKEVKITSEPRPSDATFRLEDIYFVTSGTFTGAEETFISLPEDSTGAIRFSMNYPQEGFFRKQEQIYYNQFSGEEIAVKRFADWSAGEKMKASNFDLHTGRKFGLVGKLIMFFAALIAASLPVTGFLYWRIRSRAAARALLASQD